MLFMTNRAFTAASSQGSQSSSGLSGGMAWAFQDPEHGSTTSKASGAPTTTFVNPEYQPLATNRSQVSCSSCEADSPLCCSVHCMMLHGAWYKKQCSVHCCCHWCTSSFGRLCSFTTQSLTKLGASKHIYADFAVLKLAAATAMGNYAGLPVSCAAIIPEACACR